MAPYTKKELKEVCRLCLNGIRGRSEFYHLDSVHPPHEIYTFRHKLAFLAFEIAGLSLTPNPAICKKCSQQVTESFNFKTKCSESGNQISAYLEIIEHSPVPVDLKNLYRILLHRQIHASIPQIVEVQPDTRIPSEAVRRLIQEEEPPRLEVMGRFRFGEQRAHDDVSLELEELLDDSGPSHFEPTMDEREEELYTDISAEFLSIESDQEEKLECSQCDFKTESGLEFKVHRQTHQEDISKSKPKDNVVYYCCDFCSYRTLLERNLEAHIKMHETGESHASEKTEEKNKFNMCTCRARKRTKLRKKELRRNAYGQSAKKRLYCKSCDYNTVQRIRLLRHNIEKHNVAVTFRYKCHECARSTSMRLN